MAAREERGGIKDQPHREGSKDRLHVQRVASKDNPGTTPRQRRASMMAPPGTTTEPSGTGKRRTTVALAAPGGDSLALAAGSSPRLSPSALGAVAGSARRKSVNALTAVAKKKPPKNYRDDTDAFELGKAVFDVFDVDHNGCLERHEMELAHFVLQDSPLEGAGVASGIWAYGPADIDGSGDVDHEEWHRFMESIYQILGRKQFLAVLGAWVETVKSRMASASLPTSPSPGPAGDDEGNSEKPIWGGHVETITDEASAAVFNTAAAKIQALRRGSAVRQKATENKKAHPHAHAHAHKKNAPEHQVTSIGELFDMLCRVAGTYGRTTTVGEFVELFQRAQESGLNTDLALTAPVTDPDGMLGGNKVEEFLPEQLCRLCEMVLSGDSKEMTDGEVWFELSLTRSNRVECGRQQELLTPQLREKKIDHKNFQKILSLLARAMALDVQHIVCHLAWLKTKVFEAPAPFLALVAQQCANNNKSRLLKEDAYRGVADMGVLDVRFTLNDQVKLCINGHLTEEAGHKGSGIGPNELQHLFTSMSKNLQEKLAARMDKRKEAHPYTTSKVPTVKAPTADEPQGFSGAEALQVLMEELYKLFPGGKFVSPLAMVTFMIRQGTEFPLVSEETIAANAAMAMKREMSSHGKHGHGTFGPPKSSSTGPGSPKRMSGHGDQGESSTPGRCITELKHDRPSSPPTPMVS